METSGILESFAAAIWLWSEKSDSHFPTFTGDVLRETATVADQGAIAKPPSAYGQPE
jgi:hypothetical protein